MCGIAGIVHHDRRRPVAAATIQDMCAALRHRGPDDQGIHVTYGPWGLGFASELKALLAAGLSQRTLDWEALDAFFQLEYIPAPATPFTDVRKLEPGHSLTWRATGELTVQRYWDLPATALPTPPDVERRIVEWLDDSVAAHLVSDVPVAAFLSGRSEQRRAGKNEHRCE